MLAMRVSGCFGGVGAGTQISKFERGVLVCPSLRVVSVAFRVSDRGAGVLGG